MVEAGGETILEEEEKSSQEEDAATVPRISLVDDRIRTLISQVVRHLINKKFNVIIVRNLLLCI